MKLCTILEKAVRAGTARDIPQAQKRVATASLEPGATAQDGRPTAEGKAPIICPACGGANPYDAVFCDDPACHKALGGFTYVLEELRAEARWHHRLADKVTALITKPHFVVVHALWFALWVMLNTALIAVVRTFDEFPFFVLVTILAVETMLITIFVLISNTRQSTHADTRAELDYEVNVLTYREIDRMSATMQTRLERLDRLETTMRGGTHGGLKE